MSEHRQQQKRADNARRRAINNSIDGLFVNGFYVKTHLPKPKNAKRRRKCKADLQLFMMTYFPHLFYLDMSPGQEAEIKTCQSVIIHGGTYALAAPRGDGKTTRVEIATLWAILYGYHRYVVPVGATQTDAEKMLENIKAELGSNEKLAEDFPEVCIPAQACENSPHKAKSLQYRGCKLEFTWATGMLKLPQIKGSDSYGAIIQPKGLTGSLRGLKFNIPGKGAVRPTLFLFDDPQTDDSAASPQQCKKRERYIKGAALGSGGPTDKISAFMPCTILETGDLADTLLDRQKNPQWRGTVRSMVNQFPSCFDPEGKKEGLWWEYCELRNQDFKNDLEIPTTANKFYVDNRDEMDGGAVVDNPQRIEKGEISAIQTAMNKFFDYGPEVFFAEYQNKPRDVSGSVYEITGHTVMSKVNGYDRLEVPTWAKFVVAMADINYVGLNYCVVAFDNDFTGAIVDYGKWPAGRDWLVQKNTPEAVVTQLIAQGIKDWHRMTHDKHFVQNGKRRNIDVKLVDCNMWTDVATNAVVALRSPRIIPDRGTPASKYRWPQESRRVGTPAHNAHREVSKKGVTQVRHCADYWRTVAQKAFLQEPGVPGSMSLFGNNPEVHRHFAAQICAERLLLYQEAEPNDIYQWRMAPGTANDLLDALVGCYAGAAIMGATMPGVTANKTTNRKRQQKAQAYRQQKGNGGIRTTY